MLDSRAGTVPDRLDHSPGETDVNDEKRYTLSEARRILLKQECGVYDHDWDARYRLCSIIPDAFVCARCGRVVEVVEKGSK